MYVANALGPKRTAREGKERMELTGNSSTALTPTGKVFGIGADLLGKLEETISNNKIKGVRVKLGGRVVKEFSMPKASVFVTVAIALAAVLVSSLSVEIEHEPA